MFTKFGTKTNNDSDSSRMISEVILEDGKIKKESKLKVAESTDIKESKEQKNN
jgi:hypothetical protein